MHIGDEIHVVQFNPFSLLDQFPAQVHDQHDGQFDVEADKANRIKFRAEAAPPLDEYQETVEKNGQPGSVGVCPVLEGEEMRLALALKPGSESDRGHANCDPRQLIGNTDQTVCSLATPLQYL